MKIRLEGTAAELARFFESFTPTNDTEIVCVPVVQVAPPVQFVQEAPAEIAIIAEAKPARAAVHAQIDARRAGRVARSAARARATKKAPVDSSTGVPSTKHLITGAFDGGALTVREIRERINLSPDIISPRLAELTKDGYVAKSMVEGERFGRFTLVKPWDGKFVRV